MRALNGINAFLEGFNRTYDTVGRVVRDIDLARVNNAEVGPVEQSLEQTAPDQQVNLPALDGETMAPITVPGGDLKVKKVADFLGERVNPDDKAAVDRVRQSKVADALGRYDPAEGMRMRRELRAADRDEWLHGREKTRADREDAEYAKTQDYEKGRNAVFAGTVFGRNQAQWAEQLKEWRASGGAGEPPPRPSYSPIDSLADYGSILSYDAQHGKLDPKAIAEYGQRLKEVQDAGYERALRLAHSGAPVQSVLAELKLPGGDQITPADVVKDERATGPDGVPTRRITLKNGMVIDTLAALDSLGKAGEVVSRFYKGKDDKRDDRRLALAQGADGRAQIAFNADAPARRVSQLLGTAQATLLDPAATPEQRQAASARLADLGAAKASAGGAAVPAEIQMARFVLASKMPGVTNEAQALEWVRRTKEKSPQAVRAELYKAAMQNGGDAATARGEVDQAMSYLFPGTAGQGGDLTAQAREAVARGADKAKVNERLQAQGLPPLP